MTSIVRKAGFLACGVLAAVGAWACSVTRQSDGSFTFEFAPDMTINAWGLEDALIECTELLRDCLNGTFSRTCTQDEVDDIKDVIKHLSDRKNRILEPPEGADFS